VDRPENIATLEELGKFWKAGFFTGLEDVGNKNPPISAFVGGSGVSQWMKDDFTESSEQWGVARMPAMAAGQARGW